MLRNYVTAQELTNRDRFPKNNSFGYRWRVLDNFSRSIDRQKFYLEVQGAGNNSSLLSDKILSSYKARYDGTRQDLIVELAQDAMRFLSRRRTERQQISKAEVTFSKAMSSLIDRSFNTLLAFSAELNSFLGLSELFMTVNEPEVKKRSTNSESSIAVCIQADVSTSLYRLVIEGKNDRISFFIIPTDDITAMTDLAVYYEPVSFWQAHLTSQNQAYWVSPCGVLTEEMVDVACAELIRRLLETTQEHLAPSNSVSNEEKPGYDMMADDPWMNSGCPSATDEEFNSKSGHDLMQADHRFEWSTIEPGWNNFDEAQTNAYQQRPAFKAPSAASIASCSSGFETAHVPQSSEGTRTDSVPSLASLMRESGNYSTVQEIAYAPFAPIEEEPDMTAPGIIGGITKELEAQPVFDLKKEYFEAPTKKSSKKGATNKRSTRKQNSKKGKKKR